MIRVLADRHHAGLFNSLQLLFGRLGGIVYTPRGHEWWDEGVWRFGEVYGDDRLARQYLDGWPDHGLVYDTEFPDVPITSLTLAAARAFGIDVVLATVQENQAGFARLAREIGAQYAVAVGNTGQHVDWSLEPRVINSSEMPNRGRAVSVGQEFDSDGLFGYRPISDHRRIGSFVNLMPRIPCYPLLVRAQALLPEFTFAIHGDEGPDGKLQPISLIADTMAGCGWGWHDKIHGDGFGHVIHYWAALGRPLIGHRGHYMGKRAEGLWEDGVTCIDLDRRSIEDAMALVRDISADPVRHDAMGRAIRERFDAECDWARDAEVVGELLGLAVAA